MEEGSGLVENEPSPLIQLQLSVRPMLLGVASAALAGAGRGEGGHHYLVCKHISISGWHKMEKGNEPVVDQPYPP
jgi:hypothetical protein